MVLTDILIDNKLYYIADELYNVNELFFKGCARNKRHIVTKLALSDGVYIYGNTKKDAQKKDVWKASTKGNNRAKLLITQEWAIENVPDLGKFLEVAPEEVTPEEVTPEEEIVVSKIVNKVLAERAEKYKPAPPIIILEDSEKFTAANGEFQDIEVRGIRNDECIRFRVKDIEKYFGIKDLQNSITSNKYSNFDDCYEIFCVNVKRETSLQNVVSSQKSVTEKLKNEMFLSFRGLLIVIFRNRTVNTDHYYKWASHILYTAQFGTSAEREELASNILGLSHSELLKSYSSNSRISCIYLNDIGNVSLVKTKDKFDKCSFDDFKDSDRVYKFGFTGDYLTRMKSEKEKEHKGLTVTYVLNRYVDSRHTAEAENFVRQQTVSSKSKLSGLNDYFVLSGKDTKSFRDMVGVFDNATKIYARSTEDLNKKVEDLETIINSQKSEYEKNLAEERHKNELVEEKSKSMGERYEKELQKKDTKKNLQNQNTRRTLLKKNLNFAKNLRKKNLNIRKKNSKGNWQKKNLNLKESITNK